MPDYRAEALKFLGEEVARVAPVRAGRRSGDEVSGIARAVTDAEAAFDREAVVRAYDAMAALYPTHILADPSSYAEQLVVICSHLERLRPSRVVDAGCGVGIGTTFLARVFPRLSFSAYDFLPAAVRDAQARALHHKLTNLRFNVLHHEEATATLGLGSADFVIARGSIGYLPGKILRFDKMQDPAQEITRLIYANDPVIAEWCMQMQGVTDLVRPGGAILDIHVWSDPAIVLRHFLYKKLGLFPQVGVRQRIIDGGAYRALDRALPGWDQLVPLPGEIAEILLRRSELVNLYTR